MRVLHISTFDAGGAAVAMRRWHNHLRNAGVESRVLCFQKNLGDAEIFSASVPSDRIESIKSRATQKRWIDESRTGFSDNFFSQAFFSNPLLGEPLVEWADLLHVHWISRSFNLFHLAELAGRGKPVVLTPHDLWTVTGGCHYPAGCEEFQSACRTCPMVSEAGRRLVEISHHVKRTVFSQSLSALICPSAWIKNEILRCPGFESIQSCVIPYAWESTEFWPEEKAGARSALGIPSDRNWLLFVADNLKETRKGFAQFVQLLQSVSKGLRARGAGESFGVLVAGRGESTSEIDFGIPFVNLGFLDTAGQLRGAYSSANLLVYMGLEDNLPNVITEALACGTPVLGYATGGVVDQVQPGENGILVPVGDLEEATRALVNLLLNPVLIDELAGRARKSVEQNFDNQKIVKDLIAVYENVISSAQPKVLQLSTDRELAEYEEFALRGLGDLLESAEKRSSELQGAVDWLREHFQQVSSELGQARSELGHARSELGQASSELGQARSELGSLKVLLDLSFQEIDEIFAVAPSRVRRRYDLISRANQNAEVDETDQSPARKWTELSTKAFLLKQYFDLPFWKRCLF